MYDKSQLMRGTLEGCILKILSKNTSYGYEIVTTLLGYGFKDIKEGTIYPLLVRLEKKGIISVIDKKLRCTLLHWVQAENIIPLHQME